MGSMSCASRERTVWWEEGKHESGMQHLNSWGSFCLRGGVRPSKKGRGRRRAMSVTLMNGLILHPTKETLQKKIPSKSLDGGSQAVNSSHLGQRVGQESVLGTRAKGPSLSIPGNAKKKTLNPTAFSLETHINSVPCMCVGDGWIQPTWKWSVYHWSVQFPTRWTFRPVPKHKTERLTCLGNELTLQSTRIFWQMSLDHFQFMLSISELLS